MKTFHNKVKTKWENARGMSFVEMLCAVLIFLLVSGGMTTAVSLATRQYQKSMRDSESKILCSTLATVISNELAYTTEIKFDAAGNVTQFQSQNYTIEGNLSTLMTDESGENGYGQILLGNSTNTSESMNILGKAAYTNGLLAKIESLTYDNATHYFTAELSIGYKGSEYLSYQFQVMNVNQTEAKH